MTKTGTIIDNRNLMLDTTKIYNAAWTELNTALKDAEAADGLAGAIASLEENQRQTGFIKDHLTAVERYVYRHPDDLSLFFSLQFNAKRMARFNGAPVTVPLDGAEIANGGCFLCRDNVRWQQQGAEMGYELDVDDLTYHVWMNPFPLMPCHVVVASTEHETQEWGHASEGGVDVGRLVHDLVSLASRTPGYVGFYNGVNAGASIAGHLHYQFFKRPEDLPAFPLEVRSRDDQALPGACALVTNYPLPVVKWSGALSAVGESAVCWIDDWAERNRKRVHSLTANIIVSANLDGTVTLYFVPRDRTRPCGEGMSGLTGGLEVLGEVVFSTEQERHLIDSGAIDYFVLENILRSVRTPLFDDRA
ncbi:MAG: DUF4922 domain-containing protein [Lysobacterales bacterium]|nr:MAG: DUF4922 domain-containing protein [Xanthomonadales bacterium]